MLSTAYLGLSTTMAEKNVLIPNLKLSNRERVERKIYTSFQGKPFTLKELNKLLRPKLNIDNLRMYVEDMVNNLYVEKLPRKGKQPQVYVAKDVLKEIENESPLNGAAHSFLVDLYSMAIHLREGDIITYEQLRKKREEIGALADELQAEVDDMKKLHDCTDLWYPSTLVKRLGFIDG